MCHYKLFQRSKYVKLEWINLDNIFFFKQIIYKTLYLRVKEFST